MPAMIVMETISRLIPGVLGKEESASKADHAQYTRPEIVEIDVNPDARKGLGSDPKRRRKRKVPAVLLSGDHAKIEEWRRRNAE